MEEKNKDDVKKEENFDETKTEVFDSEEEVLDNDEELIEDVEAIFDIKVSNIIKNENEYIFEDKNRKVLVRLPREQPYGEYLIRK